MKVSGIKSVDVKIEASGRGVVNWNGNGQFKDKNLKVPKMKNVVTGEMRQGEKGQFFSQKEVSTVDLSKAQMFVSQNCIRQALFSEETDALVEHKGSEAPRLLKSVSGLLRGYAISDAKLGPLMKKSPLYISDFDAEVGGIHHEILANTGQKKGSDTGGFFQKLSAGAVTYSALASINIQDLQFISTDGVYGRPQTEELDETDGNALAKEISTFLKSLSPNKNPSAEYGFWRRKSSVNKGGEYGILLDNEAIDILVSIMLDKIENLSIRRTGGFVQVDKCTVDYNDSSKFRVLALEKSSVKSNNYAMFYEKGTPAHLEERASLLGKQSATSNKKDQAKLEKESKKAARKK